MKNVFKLAVVLSAAVILMPGCASIVSKSDYPLTINSRPSDARVTVINKRGLEYANGLTPLVVKLKAGDGFFSKAEYTVKLEKPGYEEMVVPVTFSIDGWYFGNILIGGLLGMLIVDPATGAMWRIDQDYINAELREDRSGTAALEIIEIKDVTEEMKSKMVKISE